MISTATHAPRARPRHRPHSQQYRAQRDDGIEHQDRPIQAVQQVLVHVLDHDFTGQAGTTADDSDANELPIATAPAPTAMSLVPVSTKAPPRPRALPVASHRIPGTADGPDRYLAKVSVDWQLTPMDHL